MKRYTAPLLFLGTIATLLLAGCADMEKSLAKAAEDPKYLPGAYVSVGGLILLTLISFRDWSLWRSLLNTVRYMGILCVAVGPLYWLSSGNIQAATAIVVSGLLSSVMVTVLFRKDFKRWSSDD